MASVLKERREERRHYVLEKCEQVCKMTCLRQHWYTSEVFVGAMNRMFDPSPPIRTEELDYIITRHPKYNAIGDVENSIGFYSQRRQMKSLVAKGAARRKFRFYWCGNKGECPKVMKRWYETLDKHSFCSGRVVRALKLDFDEESKMVHMDICNESLDSTVPKKSEMVMEEENEPLTRVETEDVLKDGKEEQNSVFLVATSKEIVSKFESGELSANQWESGPYKKMFGMEGNESSLDESMNNILEKLEQCISGNFIGTVDNFDRESDLVFMTGFAISRIRMKCTYLAVALESALHSFYKKEKKTWQQCCEESIAVMEDIPMGMSPIIRWRTVMDWFASF